MLKRPQIHPPEPNSPIACKVSLLHCKQHQHGGSLSKQVHFSHSDLLTYSVSTMVRKSSGLRSPTACLKEPVPRSVVTQPSFDTPPTSMGSRTWKIYTAKGEHKSGPSRIITWHFFPWGCSNSASLTPASVWLAFSGNFPHTLDSAACRADEGGLYGCTPKVERIRNYFPDFFQVKQWF